MSDPILGANIDKTLSTALNGLASRQRAIANNLANVDTPGFKASDVSFESELRGALAQNPRQSAQTSPTPVSLSSGRMALGGQSSALDSVRPVLIQSQDTTSRVDGNNVDVDQQMIHLVETTISYNSLVQLTASRVAMARYAVNEGRR